MTRSRTLLSLVTLTVCGCPAPGPAPGSISEDQAPGCVVNFPIEAMRRSVGLEIGQLDDEFVPYESGDHVRSRQGGQGATMITPALRVPLEISSSDTVCLVVRLKHEPTDIDPNQVSAGLEARVEFLRTDAGFVTHGSLYDIVGNSNLQAFHMTLRATVLGPDFEASHVLADVLVADEAL